MKDELDKTLELLPRPTPDPDLAARITSAVLRRQRVRTAVRRVAASAAALAGAALALPAFGGLSPDLFTSAVPWLSGGLGLFEMESIQVAAALWNDFFSLQNTISSAGLVSGWLGILLTAAGLGAALDRRVFQPPAALQAKGMHRV